MSGNRFRQSNPLQHCRAPADDVMALDHSFSHHSDEKSNRENSSDAENGSFISYFD